MTTEQYAELATNKERLEQMRELKLDGIITRARARWYEKGEKHSKYFLNLEKRNYVSRNIVSLRNSDNELTTDQKEIMETLVQHYKNLFSERTFDRQGAALYLEDATIHEVSQSRAQEICAPFTVEEFTETLKHMSNNRAPGPDGFPNEFYKFFWGSLKHYFFKMVVESLETQSLPPSLQDGIIILIPKPQKPRNEIRSYRPITLLNSSYKIISSAIANRMKKIMPEVIGREQTGFIKGRNIADNTRLTYDLIQQLKAEKRTALFLSLDIQDAFNSVNWEFVRLVLKSRKFPAEVIHWFDMLYVGASSRIVHNGHISEKIELKRSCRQGDPVSPYFFLLVIEVLLEHIKANENIKGLKINSYEYKVSAYADDTLCMLDGSVNSCRALFNDLGTYAKFSGLAPNVSKTQAFWAGQGDSKEKICEELPMNWTKKLTVLGIVFANDENETIEENFESRFFKAKRIIHSWKQRNLSIQGKIVVIKTLLLPLFTHIFTALPNPPETFVRMLQRELFGFIWKGNIDRIKRSSLCQLVASGGQGMIDLELYLMALKISWVKREIVSEHPWQYLFRYSMPQSSYVFERNSESLRLLAKKCINVFWKQVFLSLAVFEHNLNSSVLTEDLGRHSLWFSNFTKYKTDYISSWQQKGLRYIGDIVTLNGQLMTFEELKQVYKIRGVQLDYAGLIRSLPAEWRRLQHKPKEKNPAIHPTIQKILESRKGNKHVYNVLLNGKYSDAQHSWERAWEAEAGEIEWPVVYKLSRETTSSTAYQAMQYKIITRIVATNKILYLMGKAQNYLCNNCTDSVDTISHKLWHCPRVSRFWHEVWHFMASSGMIEDVPTLKMEHVIFGTKGAPLVNHIILIGKLMILRNISLSSDVLFMKLLVDKNTEKLIATTSGFERAYHKKWGYVEILLHRGR